MKSKTSFFKIFSIRAANLFSSCTWGITNVGKRFYGYFRWYDPIHPDKSGPWTQPHTAVLS
ncbi:MAG: hypothetical protein HY841_12150 [Bacteroidetes bacterium]|nr:hypothetical protein [Bacteroidota bacterium]